VLQPEDHPNDAIKAFGIWLKYSLRCTPETVALYMSRAERLGPRPRDYVDDEVTETVIDFQIAISN
jgi:hypothetical protein